MAAVYNAAGFPRQRFFSIAAMQSGYLRAARSALGRRFRAPNARFALFLLPGYYP